MELKTINQYCIEVDKAGDDTDALFALYEYLSTNKRQYSLLHLRFMTEHIQNAIAAQKNRSRSYSAI